MSLPYDFSFYNHQSANAPFSPEYEIYYNNVGNCTLTIADPYACWAPTNFVDPFPPFAGPSFKPPSDVAIDLPVNLTAVFTRGFQPAMENTWNASIEHAFRNDYLLTVAYIGRQDYHNPTALENSPGVYNGCPVVSPTCTQDGRQQQWSASSGPQLSIGAGLFVHWDSILQRRTGFYCKSDSPRDCSSLPTTPIPRLWI